MQDMRHLHFIESPLFSCCLLTSDIHLVFASPIPNGEWTRFLPQCGQFTLTCKGLAGLIGTSLLGPDSLSPCFFYSRRYWRGNSAVFRQRLWLSCAALRGHLLFALPPSRF